MSNAMNEMLPVPVTAGRMPVVMFSDHADNAGLIYLLARAGAFFALDLHDGLRVHGIVGESMDEDSVTVSVIADDGKVADVVTVRVDDVARFVYM